MDVFRYEGQISDQTGRTSLVPAILPVETPQDRTGRHFRRHLCHARRSDCMWNVSGRSRRHCSSVKNNRRRKEAGRKTTQEEQ
ncbi:hypothetical protein NPIL_543231 [Nephila pilipes]|uniref:Uncharacterized protein n=1 Tax=Nephila pilipes TaxID=299642 RepID=A0A8X6UC03_NEPPI|nr:hypothetical protein NPIL_543231 [Nephila pilipes]